MNIEKSNLRLSKNIDTDLNKKIQNLYDKAFPPAERMPYKWLEMAVDRGTADILAILDGENFVGLFINLIKNNNILLDYFAIDENARSKGYGSMALSLLKEFYPDKNIILEIEIDNPSREIIEFENLSELDLVNRTRRKAFYLNNGLLESNIFVNLNSVAMQLLSFGTDFDFEDYIGLYIHSFGEIVRTKITELS